MNRKILIRRNLLDIRKNINPQYKRKFDKLIMERLYIWIYKNINYIKNNEIIISAFWPINNEPDLRPLLYLLSKKNIKICLPIIEKEGSRLLFAEWNHQILMRKSFYNIMEPINKSFLDPQILLIPTLGYTQECDRIGYGGGYYDKTLAYLFFNRHKIISIGVSLSCNPIKQFYRKDLFDFKLDAVVTPIQWIPKEPILYLK